MNLSRLMIPWLLADRGLVHGREVGAFRRGEHRLEAGLLWQAELDRRLSQTACTTALRVVPTFWLAAAAWGAARLLDTSLGLVSEFARYAPRRPAGAAPPAGDTFLIRRAEGRDADALARIQQRREGTGDVEARRERFQRRAVSGDELLLVGEVGGLAAGYGRVVYHPGSPGCPPGWYLMGLVVSPEFRRRGIAHQLTQARLDSISTRADRAFYVANARNLATIDLHTRLGFRELTRDFTLPGIEFEGGCGILFAVDLTAGPSMKRRGVDAAWRC